MSTKAKAIIEAEFKRRMDLVNDVEFRASCVTYVKKLGITPAEWKENKAAILMMLANKFCALENEKEKA